MDQPEFSRRVTARWQMERTVPTFTLLSGDLWPRFAVDTFDVAIVGDLRREVLSVVLEPLHSTGQPIFCVFQDRNTMQLVRERWPRISLLRRDENWLEILVPTASEAVHRSRAESRARAAELACASLDRQAMLGRYMLDMRHNLNNALTSVLGNSDLLLLEPGSLSAPARAQIETIRNMTLRTAAVFLAGERNERRRAPGRAGHGKVVRRRSGRRLRNRELRTEKREVGNA